MNEVVSKYGLLTLTFLLSYFSPALPLLGSIGFFIFADLITGILAAKKRGEEITSKKARNTIPKGLGYMIAIMVGHVFEVHFVQGLEVMKIVAGLIAVIEIKSLDENIKIITGKSLFNQFVKKR